MQEKKVVLHEMPSKQEVGFNTEHYKDFLAFFYEGKETQESVDRYMNFCLRDKVWLVVKKFLTDDGTYINDVIEKPTADSIYDMRLIKFKLFELANGVRSAVTSLERMEADYQEKMNHK